MAQRGTHFAKDPSGASLHFSHQGYCGSLPDAFLSRINADTGLSERDKAKAMAILSEFSQWDQSPCVGVVRTLVDAPAHDRSETAFLLLLPDSAEARSKESLAVDGPRAERHVALARAFHAKRPWLNELAKTRGWLSPDGKALRFEAHFSHAVSLAKGMLLEEASAANIMGSQPAYALFSPARGGYLEVPNSSSVDLNAPISRAKIFESAKSAKSFASRKGLAKSLSVVEVLVRAVKAHTLVEGASHDPLMAAIARAEAAELRALLAARELADLREKVAAMEPAAPARRSSL